MFLEATRTIVRGRQPRSGLMSLCPYVLLFPALAAAELPLGDSLYALRVSGLSPNS